MAHYGLNPESIPLRYKLGDAILEFFIETRKDERVVDTAVGPVKRPLAVEVYVNDPASWASQVEGPNDAALRRMPYASIRSDLEEALRVLLSNFNGAPDMEIYFVFNRKQIEALQRRAQGSAP